MPRIYEVEDEYEDFVRGPSSKFSCGVGAPRAVARQGSFDGSGMAMVPVMHSSHRLERAPPSSYRSYDHNDRYHHGAREMNNLSMSVFERADGFNGRRYHGDTFIDNKHCEMSPIQCKSLLTCNNEFRQTFPYVYYGLIKEVIDIRRLVSEEMIIPFRQDLRVKKELVFNAKPIKNHISSQLQKGLSGRFPCIDLGKRLVDKIVDHLWEEIAQGVHESESDRTVVQVVSRQDIDHELKINQKFSASMGINAVMAVVEGSLHCTLQRGYVFDLVAPKKMYLNVDIVTKCVFLNGGQLAVLDRDTLFQDQVEIGENRNIEKVIKGTRWQ